MKQSVVVQNQPKWYTPHAHIRTDSYVLLAALLTDTPSEKVIELVQNLGWDKNLPERMNQALAELTHAGSSCSLDSIAEDFHRLFVGLGHGELLPYGSWYLENMIQSKTLAAIRSDLAKLGIVRQIDSFEPEDHAGALCEIMALLSYPGNEISDYEQASFFNQHLSSWLPQFFSDLQVVKKSKFYQAVGKFGCCFIESEIEYMQYLSYIESPNMS